MTDEILDGAEPGPVLTWSVGDVTVKRVGEWVLPVPREMLLPDVTDDHLEAAGDWIEPFFRDGLMQLSFHTFVVESEGTTVVVDTCVGDDPIRMVPGDPTFPERLGAEIDGGLEAVDVVLCTHLHFDHVGWNTRVIDGQRVPTFPNARYLFSSRDIDHLDVDDSHDVRADDVQPLFDAGLVDLIETDHAITPEVRTFPTPGHTPGHVSIAIESEGEQALITGDATHSPIQFTHPEIAATDFDWDSSMSTRTREKLVADLADTPILVLGTHFAPPTAGRVRRGDGGVWFDVS